MGIVSFACRTLDVHLAIKFRIRSTEKRKDFLVRGPNDKMESTRCAVFLK